MMVQSQVVLISGLIIHVLFVEAHCKSDIIITILSATHNSFRLSELVMYCIIVFVISLTNNTNSWVISTKHSHKCIDENTWRCIGGGYILHLSGKKLFGCELFEFFFFLCMKTMFNFRNYAK